MKQLLARGIIDHGEFDPALYYQRQGHREIRDAGHEVAGSIQRVKHPEPRPRLIDLRLALIEVHLFPQESIRRKDAGQLPLHPHLHGQIGFGHQRSIRLDSGADAIESGHQFSVRGAPQPPQQILNRFLVHALKSHSVAL